MNQTFRHALLAAIVVGAIGALIEGPTRSAITMLAIAMLALAARPVVGARITGVATLAAPLLAATSAIHAIFSSRAFIQLPAWDTTMSRASASPSLVVCSLLQAVALLVAFFATNRGRDPAPG